MCHLILGMPILALPVFWLLPPSVAVPLYLVVVVISGLLYWQITRALRKPVTTGIEGLLGTRTEVISRSGSLGQTKYLVRAEGEIWSAGSTVSLRPGEEVTVIAVDGLKLVIEPVGFETGEKEKTGLKADERNCH